MVILSTEIKKYFVVSGTRNVFNRKVAIADYVDKLLLLLSLSPLYMVFTRMSPDKPCP